MILRILRELEGDEVFEIKETAVMIGRGSECEIVVFGDLVSRKHARIIHENEYYWIEDMNSTNGTYLNGIPVERSPLKAGDKINIGKTILLVQDMRSQMKLSKKPSVHIVDSKITKAEDILSIPSQDTNLLLRSVDMTGVETLKRENETLRKLFKLNNFITSTRNIKVLTDKILELSFEMVNAENICILLLNENSGDLEVKSILSKDNNQTVTVSRTIVNHVLDKGYSVLTSDAMDDNRFHPGKSIISANIKSVVCTPIRLESHIRGIFYADMRSTTTKFTEDDLKIVTILANMMGIAMENDFWHREALKKERLSAIGEVITGLSHYAKNIINCLKLAVEALEVSFKLKSKDKILMSMKAIRAQEKRISNLVLNMLDYSKEREPIKQKIDLKEIIQDIVDPYHDYFTEKNIKFILFIDDKFPEVIVDITAIHRVLLNLFTNALDAIKKQQQQQDGMVKISILRSPRKKFFTITVEDNGVGIGKTDAERIFDVFYSTKNFEGTGLGLAVVKKITQEHGGSVSVESELGQGAKFIVTLPMQ